MKLRNWYITKSGLGGHWFIPDTSDEGWYAELHLFHRNFNLHVWPVW